MKDLAKSISGGLDSPYMGRLLTTAVALFVIAVAVSAFFARGGAQRNIIELCVSDDNRPRVMKVYEPLRVLLSDQTRRPVILDACDGRDADLYIMSTYDYVTRPDTASVDAVYEIRRTGQRRDSAVLIRRSDDMAIDVATLRPADIAVVGPNSVNGFWVQLSMLSERGFEMPASVSDFRFVGGDDDYGPAVLGVVYGQFRVGACRLSDLSELKERGVLGEGEVAVIDRVDALPEMVVAATVGETSYYRKKLESIARLLDEVVAPANQNETVRLLKSYGIKALVPIEDGQIRRASSLLSQTIPVE